MKVEMKAWVEAYESKNKGANSMDERDNISFIADQNAIPFGRNPISLSKSTKYNCYTHTQKANTNNSCGDDNLLDQITVNEPGVAIH